MIVVVDASTFVSAALKPDSIPEQALLRALDTPNRMMLSGEVEAEYGEVLLRRKFDRFVSIDRRRQILDVVLFACERIDRLKRSGHAATRRTTNTCRSRRLAEPMSSLAAMCGACSRCIRGAAFKSCVQSIS